MLLCRRFYLLYYWKLLILIKLDWKNTQVYLITIIIDDNYQCGGIWSLCSGASLIISSILRMVMAASVANLIELIFETIGSITPAFRLFLGFPLIRSNPQYFKSSFLGSCSPSFWEAVWRVLSLEINSVASLAALVARVFGIMFNDSLN